MLLCQHEAGHKISEGSATCHREYVQLGAVTVLSSWKWHRAWPTIRRLEFPHVPPPTIVIIVPTPKLNMYISWCSKCRDAVEEAATDDCKSCAVRQVSQLIAEGSEWDDAAGGSISLAFTLMALVQ